MQGEQTLSFPSLHCAWINMIIIPSFQTVFVQKSKIIQDVKSNVKGTYSQKRRQQISWTPFTDNREHKTTSLISCPSVYHNSPSQLKPQQWDFLYSLGTEESTNGLDLHLCLATDCQTWQRAFRTTVLFQSRKQKVSIWRNVFCLHMCLWLGQSMTALEMWTLLINSRSHTYEKLWYNA